MSEKEKIQIKVTEDGAVRAQNAYWRLHSHVADTLGRALADLDGRYPWFKDDQKNFPGATEADGVCTGDHVAETLADEAAAEIRKLKAALEELRDWASRIAHDERVCGWLHAQDYSLYCLLADCPVDFAAILDGKAAQDAGKTRERIADSINKNFESARRLFGTGEKA